MKQGLFLIFAFCAISNAYAQMDCESIPSCEELGYTQASCPEGNASLKCPFDETKFYCIGGKKLADAPAPVITPEDWTAACSDTIDHCITLDSSCRCTACESGYLVTNGNCVSECDKSVAICAKESKIFKAETCTCESCPTYYEFSAATNSCERIACNTTKVSRCATYSSAYEPCSCKSCKTGSALCTGACWTISCNDKCRIYDGQANTKAATDQIGNKALAVSAAHQFYVGDKNGDFGQGNWYLPSLGEWMDFYGTDTNLVTGSASSNGMGTSGATGNNKTIINNALEILAGKGVDAEPLNDTYYWTSSEADKEYSWIISGSNGSRIYNNKYYNPYAVRCSLLLKNAFNPSAGGMAPQIGDVIYLDKTYGSAEDYDGSKEAAGIIAAISEDECDVKIINLRDLTFSSKNTAGNFNPDNPYGGAQKYTYWSAIGTRSEDITGIWNFGGCDLLSVKLSGCSCQF